MSVESKIKELLSKKSLSEEVVSEAEALGAGSVKKDTSKSSKSQTAGDKTNPKQGDSKDAEFETREGDADENQGAKVSSKIKKDDFEKDAQMGHNGAGAAPNFKTVVDPTSVVNMSNSKGNVQKEETNEDEESTPIDYSSDVASLFAGEELSEEFRTKATSLFEAVVSARVISEVTQIEEELVAEAEAQISSFKDELVEKVDSYLNYVAETYVKDNELVIENVLKNEITNDFLVGLKNLFKEHYIEVPEEKYDVLGEMQKQIDELKSKLDETMAANVELHSKTVELTKESVFAKVTETLAQTESEKFKALTADVAFENAGIYEEKLNVIKENYFPKDKSVLSETKLEDDNIELSENSPELGRYVAAISKMVSAKN
jgi:hypothetical protein